MRTVDEKVPSVDTATNVLWSALTITRGASRVGFGNNNTVTFEIQGHRFVATVAAAPPAAAPHPASAAPWSAR